MAEEKQVVNGNESPPVEKEVVFDNRFRDLPPDPDEGCSQEEKDRIDKKMLWKLDMKLIPWLCLIYLVAFLDRTLLSCCPTTLHALIAAGTNIGNAKLAGLPEDLHLTANGSQYNAALTLFFISYSLFEPGTNIMLKRFRPSIFLPVTIVIWGICMTCMGVVENFSGLAATRFFLGLAEAGLFPGVNYYLSCWYRRTEFGIRAAIFFSAAALAGSFGGLLAYLIEKMQGIGGKGGWAWIFILEGLATILIGAASFWMVHDFPDDAKFLSDADRARVIRRLKLDKQSSAEHEQFKMEYFWAAVKDYKTWLLCIVYMGADGALYAFSLFLPTIIASLGKYTTVQAQLLTIPPYAAATMLTIAVGYIADRTKARGLCNIAVSILGIIGFSMLLGAKSGKSTSLSMDQTNVGIAAVRYAGTFFGALGIYPCIPNTISWGSNNIEGVYKRGVALGIFIGWGNLNGVVSSNIYLPSDSPGYSIGHGVVLAYLILFLFGGSVLLTLVLRQENKKRLSGQRDHWVEGKSQEEIELLGDRRYA